MPSPSSSRSGCRRRCGPALLISEKPIRMAEAVGQATPWMREAGGEGAEHEALQRGLLAQEPPAAGEPAQQVRGSDSTSSATKRVSRSLAAGKSSMPPTANMRQRVDLGVLQTAGDASRSASVPGRAAACRRTPRPRPRAGARRRAGRRPARRRQDAPEEDRRAVDHDRALDADRAGDAVPRTSRSVATQIVPASATRQGLPRAPSGPGSAAHAGRTPSTRTPDARDSEDHEQRPELAVPLMVGLQSSSVSTFLRRCPRPGRSVVRRRCPRAQHRESTVGPITSSGASGRPETAQPDQRAARPCPARGVDLAIPRPRHVGPDRPGGPGSSCADVGGQSRRQHDGAGRDRAGHQRQPGGSHHRDLRGDELRRQAPAGLRPAGQPWKQPAGHRGHPSMPPSLISWVPLRRIRNPAIRNN